MKLNLQQPTCLFWKQTFHGLSSNFSLEIKSKAAVNSLLIYDPEETKSFNNSIIR